MTISNPRRQYGLMLRALRHRAEQAASKGVSGARSYSTLSSEARLDDVADTPMNIPTEISTVLVADDNSNLAEALTDVLTQWGYNALAVHSKAEARRLCRDFRPDFALVDLFIGPDSGLETAAEICKRAPNCHVVLMSGSAEAEDIVRRAAYKFLKKPFLVGDLLELIPDKAKDHACNRYGPSCDASHKEIGAIG